ncbi:hypothetical protein LPJ56_003556, partial [Coemansia sp. RSA 2599]
MNLLHSNPACLARQLSQRFFVRSLHSTSALFKETGATTQQEQKTEEKTPTAAAEPSKAGQPQQLQQQPEKIEYIGNTRFPRPRPKPRKTIQPGEAVGQQTPAGKVVHKALKEKIDDKWRDIL